jgi:DNA-binding beta-propeller fold protein YncE
MKRAPLNVAAVVSLLCVGSLIAFGVIASLGQAVKAADKTDDKVPTFRFDPDWPKALPNGWTTGVIGAIYVDKNDHVWVATRPSSVNAAVERYLVDGLGECCTPAPPVIEFDQAGKVVQAWGPIHVTDRATRKEVLIGKQPDGGPYPDGLWPSSEHAMFVDYKNNVWVTSQSNPSQVLKFTHDGKLIKQFGTGEATSSSDTANFAGATGVYVDPQTNEAYISDGYRNRRVIVIDADTGAFKRMWGAYGKPPKDPQQKDAFGSDRVSDSFSVTHCVVPDNNGLLYVCDRANSRIQVFRKDGTFVREVVVADVPASPPDAGREALWNLETIRPTAKTHLGTAWYVGFSPDREQRWMYVADGTNKKVWILRHSDLKVIGSIGQGGRQGGQFQTIHALAVDSHGNIYTGETLSGNRVQRFLFTGMRPASAN